MIIINILSEPFRFPPLVSHDRDPYAIKVVYNHTSIASYRRWRVENIERAYMATGSWR